MKEKWIKKGDKVLVISGNDRGKVGEVIAKKGPKVLVQGVNIRKKHLKAREQGQKSDIVSIERPIHISNLAFIDENGKKVKLNVKFAEDGSKHLVYFDQEKECNYRTLKKPVKS